MTPPSSGESANSLGQYLKARRALVTPADVGLPPGTGLRRTPGLRREELAALAGVSIDYLTRLERGKETRPSAPVLDSLARALQLDEAGADYLRVLADLAARRAPEPPPRPGRTVRPGVRQLLESVRPGPAYVVSRTNDVLAANAPAQRLLVGLWDWPARQRNMVRYLFLHPSARELYADWKELLPSSVAHLRALAGRDPDAPDLAELVGELVVKSPEFGRLWERFDVRQHDTGEKRFRHPEVGEVTLRFEVMELAGTRGQRLVAYPTVPGSAEHDAVSLLDMASPVAARPGPPQSPGVRGGR